MSTDKQIIVISAINLTEGGTLTILNECLACASTYLSEKYDIVALVHDEDMFAFPSIRYISFPRSKKSWVLRTFYEYFYFKKVSRDLSPYLWLSLHDMTPNVDSTIQAVYCHNPSPFFNLSIHQAILNPKEALFNTFYSYLYSINIHKNNYVIVQQNWLRKEFISRFSCKKVIVAYPKIENAISGVATANSKFTFIYPAFPRVFKNFEVICKAAEILEKRGVNEVEFILTITGSENRYSKYVRDKNKSSLVKFIGLQERKVLYDLYESSDCLIFPSKLETWGLPLTEYKASGKPILAADLPYAHETVGAYNKVRFFDPDDASALAELIIEVIAGKVEYRMPVISLPSQPFVEEWSDLFKVLLQERGN